LQQLIALDLVLPEVDFQAEVLGVVEEVLDRTFFFMLKLKYDK
jgi:hypothetical protein